MRKWWSKDRFESRQNDRGFSTDPQGAHTLEGLGVVYLAVCLSVVCLSVSDKGGEWV